MRLFRRKNEGQVFTREQVMGSRPLRNTLLEWETDEEGKVLITIPRREGWLLKVVNLFFAIPKKRQLILDDEVASTVWHLCDGEHTLSGIIEHLCRKYKLTRKEAEVSVIEFLRQLAQRRLVGFAVEKS